MIHSNKGVFRLALKGPTGGLISLSAFEKLAQPGRAGQKPGSDSVTRQIE